MGFRDPALAGRLGGLARSARYDGLEITDKARGTFADSFLFGHECSVCTPIAIPADLARDERERRASALRKLHYTRIASLPRKAKASTP